MASNFSQCQILPKERHLQIGAALNEVLIVLCLDMNDSNNFIYSFSAPYSGSRSHRVYDDRARSDELIAAKIKNFLAVSYTPDVVVLSFLNGYCDVRCIFSS